MKQFLEDFKNQVRQEAEDYLTQEGLIPLMMPEIEVEVNPETREMVYEPDENIYKEASEKVQEMTAEEILDEAEETEFENSEPVSQDDNISTKGHFSPGTGEADAEITVNLTPFDLLPYRTSSAGTYSGWANDNLEQEPESIVNQLEGSVDLCPASSAAETIFFTLQQEAELKQNKPSEIPDPVKKIYKQVVENQKEEAVATGVHEAAHAKFNEDYDFKFPDLSDKEIERIMECIQNQREGYGLVDDELNSQWIDAIEKVAGEDEARQYREFIRLSGVDEVYARLVEQSYRKSDITDLDRDDLYEEGSSWGEAGYESFNPFTIEEGDPARVSGVKVERLRDYVVENGLDSVLKMSSRQLLDQFYDEESESDV
ncbi:MAG: hypothetical protein H8Z69_01680 [Nanohaloarchaea archaeon]|nr:hypothetical protein [Candidatus Nanohaloarchaea archaeon]